MPDEVRESAAARTPTEILSYIFSLCPNSADEVFALSTYRPFNDRRTTVHPFMSLHISHVCKRWRSIAHSLPSLWTMIPVVLNNTLLGDLLDTDFACLVSVVGRYLDLSRNLPLDVVMVSPMNAPPDSNVRGNEAWLSESDLMAAAEDDMKCMRKVIKSLELHCHRWASFRACLYGVQYVIWDIPEDLPLLHTLALHSCPNNPLNNYALSRLPHIGSSIFHAASLLQRVELSGVEMRAHRFPGTFRGSVTYNRTDLFRVAELLVRIPSTATLDLYETFGFKDEDISLPDCTFSGYSLKIVEPNYNPDYRGTPTGSLSKLFESLTLSPSVRELEFVCDSRSAYAFSVVEFSSCLSRSPSSTITRFTLRQFHLTTEHLLELLTQLPLLTHLAVEEYGPQAYKINCLSKKKPQLLSASLFEGLEVKTDGGASLGKKSKNSESMIKWSGFEYNSDGCYYSDEEAYKEWEAEQLGPALLDDKFGLVVPRLTHLALGFQRSALPKREMVQMIKSRRGPSIANGVSVVGLQHFRLRYGLGKKGKPILRDKAGRKLLALEGEGLKIDIKKGVEKMETYW